MFLFLFSVFCLWFFSHILLFQKQLTDEWERWWRCYSTERTRLNCLCTVFVGTDGTFLIPTHPLSLSLLLLHWNLSSPILQSPLFLACLVPKNLLLFVNFFKWKIKLNQLLCCQYWHIAYFFLRLALVLNSNQGFSKWVRPSLAELMKWGHVLMI